jgi:hypothetical protein
MTAVRGTAPMLFAHLMLPIAAAERSGQASIGERGNDRVPQERMAHPRLDVRAGES